MKSITDPQQIFFELDMKNFKPFFTQDGKILPVEENDIDDAVLLLRYLHNITKEKSITNEERTKVLASSEKFYLKINGKMIQLTMNFYINH